VFGNGRYFFRYVLDSEGVGRCKWFFRELSAMFRVIVISDVKPLFGKVVVASDSSFSGLQVVRLYHFIAQ